MGYGFKVNSDSNPLVHCLDLFHVCTNQYPDKDCGLSVQFSKCFLYWMGSDLYMQTWGRAQKFINNFLYLFPKHFPPHILHCISWFLLGLSLECETKSWGIVYFALLCTPKTAPACGAKKNKDREIKKEKTVLEFYQFFWKHISLKEEESSHPSEFWLFRLPLLPAAKRMVKGEQRKENNREKKEWTLFES